MKIFKKVFAFAIALTAIAMATTALADNGVATYEDATVSAVLSYDNADAQATVAVVPETFGSADITVEDIYYLNQDTAANIATMLASGVGLVDELDVPASYQVVVGGVGEDLIRYDIPEYVWNNDSVGGEVTIDGVRRVGVDGSIKINGASAISALQFVLSDGTDTADYTWTFDDAISAIEGVVTFGLEINDVPNEISISINSVTPVMAN